MRQKILAMSASTIDRLLREPRSATRSRKARRAMPAARRRVPVRTFADWNEPPPGSMEMDCVAHCGEANRGSYVNSLVLTDIASGWTEAAPLVVRESGLLVETLERVRLGLPFALRALDVDNGSEFVNESLDQLLSQPWDRTHSLSALAKERSSLDRAEERRCRAQAPGLPPLPRHRRRASDHATVRRFASVRELLPALVQAGGEAPPGRSGFQTLPSAADPL